MLFVEVCTDHLWDISKVIITRQIYSCPVSLTKVGFVIQAASGVYFFT